MKSRILSVLCLLALLATAEAAGANVVGRLVDYRVGETVFKGFLAEDTALKTKRPAVLVVHEWWGHDEYVRRRAVMLAELGYVALAVDMYGDGKTARYPDEAEKLAGTVLKNRQVTEERFNAALAVLKQQPLVDPARIAAVGYCFGGTVVLQMARSGSDLKGAASFHGSLATDTPALPGEVRANLLVLGGDRDTLVPPAQVQAFLDEMTLAGASFRYIAYQGAKHGFTNPESDNYARKFGLPLAYDRRADFNSWTELRKFLHEIFKKAE
ncbi:dienelactone hydrolase family protein [Trichlorobacter ammonificans]|uniref:Dienelactone hydrolase n=1 Tax=Trichlorobacter ammonificans TaxID=2916410 RepID=A0ABM9DAM0_9BACT|nr:dienelactone hydrolase family protein [Trichlorobacter ammonificans]CAH2031410.1 Dienelactone hydrolase [Trichlorobacter ammonificans]